MRRALIVLAWIGVVLMMLGALLGFGVAYLAHVRGGLDAPIEQGF